MGREEILAELQESVQEMNSAMPDALKVARAVRRKIDGIAPETKRVETFQALMETITPMDILPDLKESFREEAGYILAENREIVDIENRTLGALIKKEPTEPEFYSQVWHRMHDELLLDTDEKQDAFFFAVWLDVRIPYYQIRSDFDMSEEEFVEILQNNQPIFNKVRFVIERGGISNPLRAAMLMDLIGALPNKREQAVFWGLAISIASTRNTFPADRKDRRSTSGICEEETSSANPEK